MSTPSRQPFSTKEQGYTVSDCTAEGLKAVMMLQSVPYALSFMNLWIERN